MGYFSEMSLDMQEGRKPSAAALTGENAFEEEESFDELPVSPVIRSSVQPLNQAAPQPGSDAASAVSTEMMEAPEDDPVEENGGCDDVDDIKTDVPAGNGASKDADEEKRRAEHPNEPGLIRALGLDTPKFRRLRQLDGDAETLAWLQLEKRTGQCITDEMLCWSKKERISPRDLVFIADRMSLVQIRNYLERQKEYFDGNCQQALTTWQDYLAMAERLHYDTSDEIVYRVRKLRQRHDELVLQSEAGSLEEQASKMAAKYPHVNDICMELQKKYAYSDGDYTVLAPQNIFAIIKEGRMLHHCVGNDGSGERYYERIERRESFIMFLRRTDEPEDPYYTLEIEPDGTVRQKRTLFDRQYEDIEQATEFLLKWQKVIAARLTGRDLKLAERSRELRKEEFIQMQKDRVIIHTGHLAGRLLADVLLADLMENTEVIQPQALPAAA